MQIKRTGDPLELNNISRRDALRIFAGAGLATVLPRVALAVGQKDVDSTNAQIEETKKQLAKAQGELDDIAAEYEKLSRKQSDTLDQIEQTQGRSPTSRRTSARRRTSSPRRRSAWQSAFPRATRRGRPASWTCSSRPRPSRSSSPTCTTWTRSASPTAG